MDENDEKIFDIFRQIFYYFGVFLSQKLKIFLPGTGNSKILPAALKIGWNFKALLRYLRYSWILSSDWSPMYICTSVQSYWFNEIMKDKGEIEAFDGI